MISTKLILFEGIPGSGKSTTARFISIQLDKKGFRNTFIHELAKDHPINFFYEMYLNKDEYDELKSLYNFENYFITKIENMYCVNFLELKRSNCISDKMEIMKYLFQFSWINDPDRYLEIARLKVQSFAKKVLEGNDLVILEGSIIQFFTDGLILNGFSKRFVVNFINQLMNDLQALNPILVYLYPTDIESAVKKMFEIRGEVYKVGRHLPYAKEKEIDDFELYIEFLNDYKEVAEEIVNSSGFVKISIDKTNGCWVNHQNSILKILDFENFEHEIEVVNCIIFEGEYSWKDKTFVITFVNGVLYASYNTYKKRLIPKNENTFYICDNSVELQFTVSTDGKSSDFFTIGGWDISQDWSVIGTKFTKMT